MAGEDDIVQRLILEGTDKVVEKLKRRSQPRWTIDRRFAGGNRGSGIPLLWGHVSIFSAAGTVCILEH